MTKYPEKRQELTQKALAELNSNGGHPGIHRILDYISNAIGSRVGKRLEWCGTFCLFLLHKVGLALGVHWHVGGGFCEEQHLTKIVGKRLSRINAKGEEEIYYLWDQLPEPGDIAYYANPFSHHAMVLAVNADPNNLAGGTYDTIDGNQIGDTIQTHHGIKLSKPTCFYSIEKFLAEEAGETPDEQAADETKGAEQTAPTDAAPPTENRDTEPPAALPTLKAGVDDKEHVTAMQKLLNEHGAHPPLVEDGHFGGLSGAALKNFQELNGLEGDEVCGEKTWAALLAPMPVVNAGPEGTVTT